MEKLFSLRKLRDKEKNEGANYREILEKINQKGTKDLRLWQKFIFQQENNVEGTVSATM